VTGAGSSAANKLSGISFISRRALGNEDGTAALMLARKMHVSKLAGLWD
jgi:hypothetical protein